MFYVTRQLTSQYFPQCVKYLFPAIADYMLYSAGENVADYTKMHECVRVNEGFVSLDVTFVRFYLENVDQCTPDDLEVFVEHSRLVGVRSPEDRKLLLILLKNLWFKGDFKRLRKFVQLSDYTKVLKFVENCLWERGYEDFYTLGQQLSIRMTTNLIQSGLDFKH